MKKFTYIFLIALFGWSCAVNQNSSTASSDNPEPRKSRFEKYTNLADALRSMGELQVFTNGNTTTVQVRSVNTYLLETEPLFVVNGLPRGRGFIHVQNLDPRNIKSITVKKGLVATNRWGQLGNSGVVLIDTISD